MSNLTYTQQLAKRTVAQIASDVGFHTAETRAIDTLAEILLTYIKQICVLTKSYAEHADKNQPDIKDLERSCNHLGIDLEQIKKHVICWPGLPLDPPVPFFPVSNRPNRTADYRDDAAEDYAREEFPRPDWFEDWMPTLNVRKHNRIVAEKIRLHELELAKIRVRQEEKAIEEMERTPDNSQHNNNNPQSASKNDDDKVQQDTQNVNETVKNESIEELKTERTNDQLTNPQRIVFRLPPIDHVPDQPTRTNVQTDSHVANEKLGLEQIMQSKPLRGFLNESPLKSLEGLICKFTSPLFGRLPNDHVSPEKAPAKVIENPLPIPKKRRKKRDFFGEFANKKLCQNVSYSGESSLPRTPSKFESTAIAEPSELKHNLSSFVEAQHTPSSSKISPIKLIAKAPAVHVKNCRKRPISPLRVQLPSDPNEDESQRRRKPKCSSPLLTSGKGIKRKFDQNIEETSLFCDEDNTLKALNNCELSTLPAGVVSPSRASNLNCLNGPPPVLEQIHSSKQKPANLKFDSGVGIQDSPEEYSPKSEENETSKNENSDTKLAKDADSEDPDVSTSRDEKRKEKHKKKKKNKDKDREERPKHKKHKKNKDKSHEKDEKKKSKLIVEPYKKQRDSSGSKLNDSLFDLSSDHDRKKSKRDKKAKKHSSTSISESSTSSKYCSSISQPSTSFQPIDTRKLRKPKSENDEKSRNKKKKSLNSSHTVPQNDSRPSGSSRSKEKSKKKQSEVEKSEEKSRKSKTKNVTDHSYNEEKKEKNKSKKHSDFTPSHDEKSFSKEEKNSKKDKTKHKKEMKKIRDCSQDEFESGSRASASRRESKKRKDHKQKSSKHNDTDRSSNSEDNQNSSKPDDEREYYCPVCNLPYDGNPMICCDICEEWYHYLCVNISEPPPEKEPWYCQRCRPTKEPRPKKNSQLKQFLKKTFLKQ